MPNVVGGVRDDWSPPYGSKSWRKSTLWFGERLGALVTLGKDTDDATSVTLPSRQDSSHDVTLTMTPSSFRCAGGSKDRFLHRTGSIGSPNLPHSMKSQYVGENQETLRYQKFQPWEVPVQFDEESCWFQMSELFC